MHDNLNRKKQEKPRNSVKESKKSCHQHHHRFSFVQKCTHYRKEYYCCPPYATKGGIRSLLFEPSDCPHASSVEEDTSHSPRSSSFHWPLPFHFHLGEHLPISSKYLSNLIGDRNHNISWDSLGNSHCFNASFHQTQTKGQSSKKHSESITSKSDCTAYTYPCSKSIDPQVLQNTINMVKSHNDSTDTVSMQEGLENGVPGLSALLSFLAFEDESPAASTGKDASTHHNPQSSLLKHNVAVADQSISSVATGSIVTNTNTTTITTNTTTAVLEKATIVYHESARSIVFRDHLRRAHKHTNANANRSRSKSNVSTMSESSDVSLKVSHDPSCSNVGTTNHAVGTGSGSIASSVDDHQTFSNGTIEECDDAHSNHNNNSMDNDNDPTPTVIIANYTPQIDPLPPLELEPHNEFSELLLSNPYIWNEGEGPEEAIQNDTVWLTLSDAEKKVVDMLLHQKCAVKTIKNADLTAFISKFPVEDGEKAKRWMHPIDFSDATKMQKIQKYKESDLEYHSFFTSLSLLPSYGLKMRCYGSTREYPLGVVFELEGGESEDSAAKSTHSWSWPAGYAAKTEYNIAMNGALINGREEALVPISHLRKLNHSYIYDRDYGKWICDCAYYTSILSWDCLMCLRARCNFSLNVHCRGSTEVLGKIIKGGFNTLPYNELYCRIGGSTENARSFDDGLGLPVAIFARTASFGDLTALLRLRARLGSVIGKDYTRGLPLLLIDQDMGTRVLSDKMQQKLLSIMSNSLNPFQNPHLKHRTKLNATSEKHFQQKLEELLDLDDENIRNVLTAEECARLAGGFGASDESVARLLMDAMIEDHEAKEKKPATFLGAAQNKLQNIVNEGLTAAVRSGNCKERHIFPDFYFNASSLYMIVQQVISIHLVNC